MARVKRWPNVPPLMRGVTLTEKLDGHTVGLHIEQVKPRRHQVYEQKRWLVVPEVPVRPGDVFSMDLEGNDPGQFFRVTVQNKTRLVTLHDDMAGIARWASDNAAGLVAALGPGIHFGEWWGYKICRSYDLDPGDRRLSLFNTHRWKRLDGSQVPGLHSVPVLWEGSLESNWLAVPDQIDQLKSRGSVAAPGYPFPEGIVVYHHEADSMFKVRIPEHNRKNIRMQRRGAELSGHQAH